MAVADNTTNPSPQPAPTIDDRQNKIALLSLQAKTLAGLLETLSGKGYSNACAADDEWQMRWWGQAGYIADAAEDIAQQIYDHVEEIEEAQRITPRGAVRRTK